MMQLKSLGLVAFVVLGCSHATDTGVPVVLQVSQIDAPASVATGSSFRVNLTVGVGNCLVFDHIEVRKSASDILLTVWGTDVSNLARSGIYGNIGVFIGCAPAATEGRSVTVQAASPGTLSLVVDRGRLSPLIATVQVQ
jgi:hypothetical protein